MENKMKLVSIDLETTGLNEDNCQVIEFGAVIDDLSDPKPIKELPKFQCYIRHPEYKGEAFALQLNQKIFKILATDDREKHTIYNPGYVADAFKEFLFKNGYNGGDTIVAAGKNFAKFDWQFMKGNPLNLDKIPGLKFHHRMIDPGSMYMTKDDIVVPGTEECQRRAGLKVHVAHNAIDDAYDVIRLIRYKKLCFGEQMDLKLF